MPKKSGETWNQYEKLVLSKLDSHDKQFSDLLKQLQSQNDHLSDFKVEMAKALDAHKTSCKIAEEFPKISRDISGIKASLENLRKMEKAVEQNTTDIGVMQKDVVTLQVKSGLWGALGGVVSLATVILAVFLEDKFPILARLMRGG